jgi:glycogen synthase
MQQRFDWQEPAQAYRALYQTLLALTAAPLRF